MLKNLLAEYISKAALFGFLLSSICSMISFRYNDKLKKYCKLRRVWWRLISIALICLMTIVFFDLSKTSLLYLLLPLIIIIIIIVSILPLPHEKWIANNIRTNNSKSIFILTTAGKVLIEFSKFKISKEEEKQISCYRLYKFLQRKELLPHEIDNYYIPVILELFKLGAIKLAKEEVEKIEKNSIINHRLHLIKAFIDHSEYRVDQMKKHLFSYLELSNLSHSDRLLAHLNILSVANESNDDELLNKSIEFIEDAYYNHKTHNNDIVFHLLFHYDKIGQSDKSKRILQDIDIEKFKDLNSLIDYTNIVYAHYRLHEDKNGQIKALLMYKDRLTKINEYNEKTRLLGNLSLLSPLFDTNALWEEFSIELFNNSQVYLNHSYEVAATFISECLKLLQSADDIFKKVIPNAKFNKLINEMESAVYKWEPELRKEIEDTPLELLYKRRDLYIWLIDFIKIKFRYPDQIRDMQDQKIDIYEKIINNCRVNGNTRELIHFLNVYCDNIITDYKQVLKNNIDQLEIKRYIKKYEEFYKPIVLKYIKEMEDKIISYRSNKSLNFYVLYLANYSIFLEDIKQASFYFHLFENYKIEIKYFNLNTQQLYKEIKSQLTNN